MQQQPLETPPPYLSASIATTLHKSSGYVCKGETSTPASTSNNNTFVVVNNQTLLEHQQQQRIADGSLLDDNNNNNSSKQVSSVKELLEIQEKEIGGMKKLPDWATRILKECALKEEKQ
jgi:hypothetical protein